MSRAWNRIASCNDIWKRLCIDCNILPMDYTFPEANDIPLYHDTFRRAMTTLYNWKYMRCRKTEVKYHKGPVLSLIMIDRTRVFSGDIDGSLHNWNMELNEHHVVKYHASHIACMAHSAGILATGSSDHSITLVSVYDFKLIRRLLSHEEPVTALTFGSTSSTLFSGSTDRTIRIWNTDSGTCLRILHGQDNTITSLIHNPKLTTQYFLSDEEFEMIKGNEQGWLISGSNDHSVFLWDLKGSLMDDTPEVVRTIMDMRGPITALAMFDESHCSSTKNTDQSADATFTLMRQPINVPPFIVAAAQFDTTMSLWSLPTFSYTKVHAPNRHQSTIWSISTAIIHSKIITASGDKRVIVWDLKSPREMHTLGGFDSAVVSSSVGPLEDGICFGTEKGSLVFFDLQEFM